MLVQPFSGFVTKTLYMPGEPAERVGSSPVDCIVLSGKVQSCVSDGDGSVLEAVMITEALLQFRLPETLSAAPGAVLSRATLAVAVLVHPLLPVTVKI